VRISLCLHFYLILIHKLVVQSQAAITLELVTAEHASLTASQLDACQASPSAFVTTGLEIEEAQYVIHGSIIIT
jgi:hypothetical protein